MGTDGVGVCAGLGWLIVVLVGVVDDEAADDGETPSAGPAAYLNGFSFQPSPHSVFIPSIPN